MQQAAPDARKNYSSRRYISRFREFDRSLCKEKKCFPVLENSRLNLFTRHFFCFVKASPLTGYILAAAMIRENETPNKSNAFAVSSPPFSPLALHRTFVAFFIFIHINAFLYTL